MTEIKSKDGLWTLKSFEAGELFKLTLSGDEGEETVWVYKNELDSLKKLLNEIAD